MRLGAADEKREKKSVTKIAEVTSATSTNSTAGLYKHVGSMFCWNRTTPQQPPSSTVVIVDDLKMDETFEDIEMLPKNVENSTMTPQSFADDPPVANHEVICEQCDADDIE